MYKITKTKTVWIFEMKNIRGGAEKHDWMEINGEQTEMKSQRKI